MTATLQDHKAALLAAANALAESCTAEALRSMAAIEVQPGEVGVLLNTGFALRHGERYAGVLLHDDGTPSHHLVLLPGSAEDVDWQESIDWAKGKGAELPTRSEQALLFANVLSAFEPAWYWSCQAAEGSFAWTQYFSYGDQDYYHKSFKGRARAVRRVAV